MQQQFRLWQKLPLQAHKPLPFDEIYQPLGWSDHYQLSLGFDDVHDARVFSIPAGKDFVNAAGAQWLQTTYGALGWNCQLNASGTALSFSYSPTGITDTIAFLLYRSGNVRLTALNTKSAIFHAARVLSLAFVDEASITPNLIVGAPVVSNETALTTEQLGIFTQRHVNRGGYTVDHGEVRAKTTLNAAFIKATKQFNVNGHSWVNRAAITGDGSSAFVLQENLDNTGQTIQLGETLSIQAASVNNQQGTLTGSIVRTQVTGSIDNTQGKISSTKRVRISAQTLMNETGLISSPYGLDLRNIADVQVGGIDTHGDILLKEGQFTFTSATAMGNADGKTEHKIRKLVIEPNPALPEHLPVELLGTINAKAYRARFNTMFGSDVRIDQVNTDDDAKVTFTPGQIKRLITRMKDNPLTPELVQDLERLEWLLEDEADVLPYDVNMAGQLILRPIPGGVAIPKWLITKNSHANKGLELHLHDSDIIMGDGAGTTYPEWIADTGPLHMFGKTMDQKSGLIAACAGGSIETQGKLKLGEACGHKNVNESIYNGLGKGDFSVAANAAAIALDYNMMPTLLDEACREYYGLTEAALDAREAARPATPRTFAAIKALERYDALKESAHGREYVLRQESDGTTREQVAQVAYEMAEQDIALNASWKVFKGEELSFYEQGVRNDFFVAQGLSIFVGRVGGPLAVSAVSKPVAKLVAKGLKNAKPAVKIKAAEMESLYTPQAKTSSSFLQFDTKASAITKKAVNPHGNSLQYAGDTHVYAIRDAEGHLYKIGDSMKGKNAFGLSRRAEAQAKRLEKQTGQRYGTEIREIFGTKAEARAWETGVIERFRRMYGKELLPGNKGNR